MWSWRQYPYQRAQLFSLLLSAVLCACQPKPLDESTPAQVSESTMAWPAFDYRSAGEAGGQVYVLDPAATQVDVVVRRAGALARFGHDHVVVVRELEGFLLLNGAESGTRADLRFRQDRLEVDSTAARERYGLDTRPDAKDIEGTRSNLMEHVLDATTWPETTLELTEFERQDDHYSAWVTIGINGNRFSARQPFRLREANGTVVVDGSLLLLQTELGLQPFSTLGGGLRVADPLEVHVHIVAAAR